MKEDFPQNLLFFDFLFLNPESLLDTLNNRILFHESGKNIKVGHFVNYKKDLTTKM